MAVGYELRKTEITVVALTPGFLPSEAMLYYFGLGKRIGGMP